MTRDERRDNARCEIHDRDRDDYRRDHDLKVAHHADRGDDGVEREYQVDYDDLKNHRKHCPTSACLCGRGAFPALDLAVDFPRRLGDQEKAAADQDEVVPGEILAEQGNDRVGEPDQRGQPEQQDDAEYQRECKPEPPHGLGLSSRQPRH